MYEKIHGFGLIYFFTIIVSGVISFESDEIFEGSSNSNSIIINENLNEINIGEEILTKTTGDWDVLIFTQQWPVTVCYQWMEEDNKNSCNLPNEKEFWTIHGIWPTKYGTTGPGFCNRSATFDINKLNNIVDELKLYWPEVEVQPDMESLWKHEWFKHGTCAAEIQQLNDENKYFSKGLEWRNKYLISTILSNSGIHPDSENTVINIHNALRKYLNHNPVIRCLYSRKKDASYLSEIRICFNKTLNLIDCNGVLGPEQFEIDYPGGSVITNCHISKAVQYPSIVPPLIRNYYSWKFPFVNFYKLLNFIMWSTL